MTNHPPDHQPPELAPIPGSVPNDSRGRNIRRTLSRLIPILSSLVGAASGGLWFHHWGAAAVGLLLGLVIGLEVVRSLVSRTGKTGSVLEINLPSATIPWLSRVSWTGIALVWIWAIQTGAIHGEGGGLLLVLGLIPATGFFWLIGGPLLSNTAQRTLERIAAGELPESDATMARRGLNQSRFITATFLLVLIWLLSQLLT